MIKNTSPILRELRQAAMSEPRAVVFLEQQRWGDAPACPLCGSAKVYQMRSVRTGDRNKDFRWRCYDCRKMYTVRTGTVFEETRLPLRVWVYAFWKACSSKKGISALQLARETEITHKSALFVLRRIRHGVGAQADAPKLTGTVEVDETFIGGKRRLRAGEQAGQKLGKVPVLGMVQRQGDVRFRLLERVTWDRIGEAMAENAELSARIITDELPTYRKPASRFAGGHFSVNHGQREYARAGTDIHSNTVESVFSLIKRGVMGTFHSVSKKHLPNYLNEFEFRWNTRKVDDGERVSRAIRRVDGKRLTYRESVDNPPYLAPWVGQADAPFEG